MAINYKVIQANESLAPFLGARMTFTGGLDPLGLQNTSEATYSFLLPGLNNVTGRIRYYSFYCWLLQKYTSLNEPTSTDPKLQRDFIRTAEYIIALCSQYYDGENGSIPGSNYAAKRVEESTSFDLSTGIANLDGSTDNTYWKFSWGAFGQYYRGSLKDIGIIEEREQGSGLYIRTKSNDNDAISGEMLANAFEENIPLEARDLFFSMIKDRKTTSKAIQQLLPYFNLTVVPSKSSEERLLLKLLIQHDYPLRNDSPNALRQKTIRQLLRFAASQPESFTDMDFVYNAYISKGRVDNTTEESLFGWYYYQINEYWHYANTAILNGILGYLAILDSPGIAPLQDLITDVVQKVEVIYRKNSMFDKDDIPLSAVLDSIEADELDCVKSIKNIDNIEKVYHGLNLIFTIYRNNESELLKLKEFGKLYQLSKDQEVSTYFTKVFQLKLEQPFKVFLKNHLFRDIIYRHQYVALRKMGGGSLSTQKFVIEDYTIRFIDNFTPSFTGPRIGNLISFLKDLNVFSSEGKTTNEGDQLLTELSTSDD